MPKGIKITQTNGRKTIEGLGYYKPLVFDNLRDLVKKSAAKYNANVGFKFKDKNGNITGKTYTEFDRDVDYLGTTLISLGLKNLNIAIIGENRYEWAVSYVAIVNGTGVAVPLDKYLPANEVENLLERGKAEAVFYTGAYQQVMSDIQSKNNNIKYFISMDELPASIGENNACFMTLRELLIKGKELLEAGDRSFVDAVLNNNNLSVLLFTSGTTNMSKGVMLSHENIASNVSGITSIVKADTKDVHLSLLPLHHTFENTIGLFYMVANGVCIAYCEGLRHVAQNLKEYNVSILVAVPAIFESMYKKLMENVEKSGKAAAFRILGKISDVLRFIKIDARKILFKSVFKQLGPNLRLGVSGAASLDPDVIEGFDRIGFRIVQGYGLTETSPLVSGNNDFISKPGTNGYPIAGVEIAIDSPDSNGMGEIITRSKSVMIGYYENPEATSEAIDSEGWFHTGDLGIFDEDECLKITGRAKSMIVLTNGKKAFPEEYEVLINTIPGVKDSFVWGNTAQDGDVHVCAKVVLDPDKLILTEKTFPTEKELAEKFASAIREINKRLPQYKIIRYFVLTYEDLVKTTTLKVKRSIEYERIKQALEQAGIDMRKATGKFIEKLLIHH